jgi:nucleoside-diphosphate-sugar epimerase
MKVLLTGGSGFLGSHIAEQLSARGTAVRALVRKSSDTSLLRTLAGVELAYGAVEERASLDEAVSGCDAVIHSAGLVKARRPEEFHAINAEGTRKLLDAIAANGPTVKRFVLVSSLAAVGPSEDGKPVAPDANRPVTHYGRAKAAAERIAQEAAGRLTLVVIRPPMIYGPRDRETLAFFKSVDQRVLPFLGAGQSRMSVVYGPDAAGACIRALEADVKSGSTYFLDDGRVYVWKEMLEEIEHAIGKRALLRIGLPFPIVRVVALVNELYSKLSGRAVMMTRDKLNELSAPHWVCDSSDTQRELGWAPAVDWPEGVKRSLAWYREQHWL